MLPKYQSILEVHPEQNLFQICLTAFSFSEQSSLIKDIFFERLNSITPWLLQGLRPYESALPTSLIAFNGLLRQEKTWLDSHHLTFEELLRIGLEENLTEIKSTNGIWEKIKYFYEETRSGLTVECIRAILDSPERTYSEIKDLELHLIWIKMREKEWNASYWEDNLKDKLTERPWLTVALIYVYKKEQPFNALKMLQKWDNYPGLPFEPYYEYAKGYIYQALNNCLSIREDARENSMKIHSLLQEFENSRLRVKLEETIRELPQGVVDNFYNFGSIESSSDTMRKIDKKIDDH